ncbi:hypothetical protein A9K55_007954 [Cordyceps militaris]|uniref:Uncharacterized protein n=1 Tax=Cordyceps militaris TaxID=73501 RepID=A0A2H4SG22_CORMI|nr:hypothetical protein A9K55_007954 [Cordyceps militaris]
MDAPEPVPSISPAKQDRILIWRSEVELATTAGPESDGTTASHDGASSNRGGSSATSTTTSSRASSSRSAALVLARGRHALAKVARKLAWPRRRSAHRPAREDRGLLRTAMYARLSPDYQPAEDEEMEDGAVAPLRRYGEPPAA